LKRPRNNKVTKPASSVPQISEVGHLASLLLRDEHPVLLLGAGASVKSGIPAAEQMAQLAVRWAWCLGHVRSVHDMTVMRSDWWPWLQSHSWFDESRSFAELYPVVMKELFGVKERRREFLAHMIRATELDPTKGYEALANLLHEEFITTVLTSNFDERLLEAQTRLSRPHALTVMRTADDLIRFSTAPHAPQLLFLHGSVDHYSDKNLADELENLDPEIVKKLSPMVRDHPVIVVGYRGAEPSIMRGLFQTLVQETSGFLRGVYWCVRGDTGFDGLHSLVKTFARTIGSNFQLVPIRGFEELMSEDLWPALAKSPRRRGAVSAHQVLEAPFDMSSRPELAMKDLDWLLLATRLTQYAGQLGVGIPVSPDDAWALEQARERHLVVEENSTSRPTHAGWLLFAKRPQTALVGAQIEFVAHGPEVWIRDSFGEERSVAEAAGDQHVTVSRFIEGHLWNQMDTALDLLTLVNQGFRLKGAQSSLAYPYDPLAIKEIVVNALVHRDYQRDEPVRIEVSEQSIMIVSPGGVTADVQNQAGGVELEQAIRAGRRGIKGYRNPVISDLFYGGQRMDRKGSGLADVLERCRANGGDVRFGATEGNSDFKVELFARPEAVDAVTRTAVVAGRDQVRYAANLLTVLRLPPTVWHVGVVDKTADGVSKALGIELPPAFVSDGRLFSFYDLTEVVDGSSDQFPDADIELLTLAEFLNLPYGERALVRLLNLSLAEHLESRNLVVERERQRAYFPKTDARLRIRAAFAEQPERL
jgi:NAD-dependent SIR2 family protein deacetylase